MASLLAGVVQVTSGADLEHNLSRSAALVAEAAKMGAKLVVLPENFAFLGEHETAKMAVAEAVPGDGRDPVDHARAGAHARGRPGARRYARGGQRHARAQHLGVRRRARPRSAGIYRKIHLFDVAIPDGAVYRESASVKPGDQPVVVDGALGKVGLTICYDLRFPELYRRLVGDGARILTVPAAFTLHTGRDHWHPLLKARAIENLAFVLAAAQFGRHNAKRVTFGHACIVDPWGHVLAEVGDREGVAVAELDFDYQDRMRRELPALEHRRL